MIQKERDSSAIAYGDRQKIILLSFRAAEPVHTDTS